MSTPQRKKLILSGIASLLAGGGAFFCECCPSYIFGMIIGTLISILSVVFYE